ncbi:MAG: Sec-independent protein translocase protein TatA [Planctomycetota bacterium]|jgi:Sec-independent protein translocase protein TatA
MLAIISNLSPGEVIVVLIASILIFGRRLPEVAAKGAVQLQKLRRGVNDFKRESGFDEEIRKAKRLVDNPIREAAKELKKEPASWRPPSPRVAPHPDALAKEVIEVQGKSDKPEIADAKQEPVGTEDLQKPKGTESKSPGPDSDPS